MVVHESINIFGGFAPFPNTIMIPTMGLQSDVIGFRFGFGYEKGKRTLRAMSNEQFNTLNEEAEQKIYKEHDATAINFFKMELDMWRNLQSEIIEKSVEIEKMKANRTPSAMAEIIQTMNTAVSAQGATVTWENLAETWNNFFGGGQVFNNYVNAETSSTGQPTPPGGPGEPRLPRPPQPQPPPPAPTETPKQIAQANIDIERRKMAKDLQVLLKTPKTIAKRRQGFSTPERVPNPTWVKINDDIRKRNNLIMAMIRNFIKNFGEQPNIISV